MAESLMTVEAHDLGDANASSDVRLTLILEEGAELTGIRAFMVPTADQGAVTTASASSLSTDSYNAISLSGDTIIYRFTTGLLDWNGNMISNGSTYQVMFLLIRDDREELAAVSAGVTLSEEPYLSGRYTGTWNDNLYTDFAISANLTFANDTLSGRFYYSATFSPCCGGGDDGRIEVAFNQQAITFFYDQDLLNFMGGRCPGEYNGNGVLQEDIVLSINFTGDDCEGPHTDGRILLTKML